MVDFKKLITKVEKNKKIHPCEIYETLDRAVDKGPLRPVQAEILEAWFAKFADERDVILKLHTGQGKTLIGLLILQSRINQEKGSAVYLCPNNYLIEQTCQQADSFGIPYTTIEKGGFEDFSEGKTILITSVQKMFNGLSKFGLNQDSLPVATLLMDDSHTCIEIIKDAYKITLKRDTAPYAELLDLFGEEIERQGVGTYADIRNRQYEAFLPVPYWDWQDKESNVARILSKYAQDLNEVRFAWPLIKDELKNCFCVISGKGIEIAPHVIPLEKFGSYFKAQHRVFMSATLIDDSFLIRGLGLNSKTIKNPLSIKHEKWSGERMVLIPSLIDESLDREEIVNRFSKIKSKPSVVILSPSFRDCKDWEGYGCSVAKTETIKDEIEKLKKKDMSPLVIVNRYDGIDLPDHTCRILIFDSKPFALSLIERYLEKCRKNSDFINKKSAQTIEQGMGRGVRGEKDYCVVLLIGPELVKFVKSKETQKYFSSQTKVQIKTGIEIAKLAKEELTSFI